MNLEIKLSEEQVQRTLNVLGREPYMEVADIIDVIKKQANEQLEKSSQ